MLLDVFKKIHRFDETLCNFSEGIPFELTLYPNQSMQFITSNQFILQVTKSYRIKVKSYMTCLQHYNKRFHDIYNKGVTMPTDIMYGQVLKHSHGLYYMDLVNERDEHWIGWVIKAAIEECKELNKEEL